MLALLPFFLFGAVLFVKPSTAGISGMASAPIKTTPIRTSTAPLIPQKSNVNATEKDVLARTLFGEDRNGGYRGMQSVANIVLNRAKMDLSMFGRGIIGVCKKKGQFSCWNPETGYVSDSNIKKNYKAMMNVNTSDKRFVMALEIAELALTGKLSDVTRGAVYYLTKTAYQEDQKAGKRTGKSWSYGQQPLAVVNSHYFFSFNQVNRGVA